MDYSPRNDWLVSDSEGEGISAGNSLNGMNHAAQVSLISNVSNFPTAKPVSAQNADNYASSISHFPSERATKAGSSVVEPSVSMSASTAPSKLKLPRPRPAYKGKATKSNVSGQDTSILPVSGTVSTGPTSLSVHAQPDNQGATHRSAQVQSHSDPAFSLSIADRAKTQRRRQRHATTDGVPDAESARNADSSFIVPPGKVHMSTMIIELSPNNHVFNDHTRSGSRPNSSGLAGVVTDPNASNAPSNNSRQALHPVDVSALPPSDPPTSSVPGDLLSRDSERNGVQRTGPTPPSSPFTTKKRRRRLLDEDDYLTSRSLTDKGSGEADEAHPDPMKDKTKKTRDKKGKTKALPSLSADPLDERPASKKRRTKEGSKKNSEKELKSSTNVDDSSEEDDLLLKPCGQDECDPVSAIYSIQPSRDVPCERGTTSALPLVSMSALHSISTSVTSSAGASAPLTARTSDIPIPSNCRPDKGRKEQRTGKQRNPAKYKSDDLPVASQGAAAEASEGLGKDKISIAARTTGDGKRIKRNTRDAVLNDPEDELDSLKAVPQAEDVTQMAAPIKGKSRKGQVVSSDNEHGPVSEEGKLPQGKKVPDADKGNQSSAAGGAQSLSVLLPKRASTMPRMPPRKDSMSAIIRRASAKVDSTLASPSTRGAVYSNPLTKASRVMLSRIAPLHSNRRTPPPAPPRLPPPKKSKKMIELEERWEEELAETVEGWACMTEEERVALRRAKRDAELGYDD